MQKLLYEFKVFLIIISVMSPDVHNNRNLCEYGHYLSISNLSLINKKCEEETLENVLNSLIENYYFEYQRFVNFLCQN